MEIISVPSFKLPQIICGGMGVNISTPLLAKTVSMLGEQGTISGVALDRILAMTLQSGDYGGHFRRALAHFPFPEIAHNVIQSFYSESKQNPLIQKRGVPVWTVAPSRLLIGLAVCANFAFVWLAKEGHTKPVSINYLEKLAMPHIYAITGAMLAGVDFITMGAGIPLQIPNVINCIAENRLVEYNIHVSGTKLTSHTMIFNPKEFFGKDLPEVKRPGFIPIIASDSLAYILSEKLPKGSIHGFVVEGWKAGGHNAPPRKVTRNEAGQALPVYGPKDEVNYAKIKALGLPFWIGGGLASPEHLQSALALGATGIQVGSIFALCNESGMMPALRNEAREHGYIGDLVVRKDMLFSPTGFPFQVAVLDGSVSEIQVYESRKRICNQGMLVFLYEKPDGTIGYRCPSEPVSVFVRKGGNLKDTVGRGCLCNGLFATVGIGSDTEPPLITLGDDLSFLRKVMKNPTDSYSAKDAINFLLGEQHK